VPSAIIELARWNANADADNACHQRRRRSEDQGDRGVETKGRHDSRKELVSLSAGLFVMDKTQLTWLNDVALKCMFCMNTNK
jgi:hypothetical protein